MSARIVALFILFAFILFPPLSAMADREVDQLKQEINQLKKEVHDLKELINRQQQAGERETSRVDALLQKVEQKESSLVSRFTFRPYGFIKLDTVYDTSRSKVGNFALYAENESRHRNDNEFNMTARQTRLGLDIFSPDLYGWQAWGRIEIDFYGDGAKHENKGAVLLRHAFVELKKGKFSLLAGQTSDIISPLFPNTLNYTVGWSAGNIGYRRPQLRASYSCPLTRDTTLLSTVGISRTTGTVNEDLDLDLQNDGEDAGFPTVQGRLALATRILTDRPSVFGISGHYGKEEVDWKEHPRISGRRETREKSWSANGDLQFPITTRLELKAEAFVGFNLDDYFGGILQGVNPVTGEVIKTAGGWMQLSYRQSDKWSYHLGFGIDDPHNDDLSNGMRSCNSFFFGNAIYTLIPPVDIGLEYSFWDTEYIRMSSGTDNRIQGSVIFKW